MHDLGTVREKIGGDRLVLAHKDFDKILEIDIKNASGFNGRGLVKERLGKMESAV